MKLLIIGILCFFGYRLFLKNNQLDAADPQNQIKEEKDDGGFTDYEELD